MEEHLAASNGPLTEKWRIPHSCHQLHLIYRMGGVHEGVACAAEVMH